MIDEKMNLQWIETKENLANEFSLLLSFYPFVRVHLVLNDIEKEKEENMAFFQEKIFCIRSCISRERIFV